MAAARILGQDTVSGGAAGWWQRFGVDGWRFLNGSGTLVYNPPPYLSDLAVSILGNGGAPLVDGVKNPGGLAMPGGGTTQRSLTDGSFADPTALGLGVAITPTDDAPRLASVYTYRNDGGVSLKFTVWNAAGTLALTPTWSVPTPLSGYGGTGYWIRFLYSGAVLLKIEKISGGSSVPLTGIAFGARPLGFAGLSQGFAGHGVF